MLQKAPKFRKGVSEWDCSIGSAAAEPMRMRLPPRCPRRPQMLPARRRRRTSGKRSPRTCPWTPPSTVPVVVAATAIAAGDRPESKLVVRRVSVANPEHRLVTCIASSIAAGALEKSQFVVKKVYKKKVMEDNHAA